MNPSRCAVIFDWNGTLLADTRLMLRATNATLATLNKEPVSMEAYRAAYNIPFDQMYVSFGCTKEEVHARQAEVFETYGLCYESGANALRTRRGASELLSALKESGHKTAILSNYVVDKIEPQAERLGLLSHFDAILANRSEYKDTLKKCTKGERLQAFIEAHKTERALIVGDTVEEIEIARQYGFMSIAIENGSCTRSRLRQCKPDFQVGSLRQIMPIVRRVFAKGGQS